MADFTELKGKDLITLCVVLTLCLGFAAFVFVAAIRLALLVVP